MENKKGGLKRFLTNPETKKTLICVLMVTISSIIYCLGVLWFLAPAELYSGGVTGLAQLIVNACDKWFGVELTIGIFVFIINIPILIYGWKGVSKRFVICSLISIVVQTALLSGIIPMVDLGVNVGHNPLTGTGVGPDLDLFLLSVIGGAVCGVGVALSLKFGTSTGGFDVLAQAVAFKKHISIGYISMVINVIIAILGGLLYQNPAICFYTMVRIIVQSIVTDKIHTAYNYMKVEILTMSGPDIVDKLISDIGRGITLVEARGGYTRMEKSILETVVSSYEAHRVVEDARRIDPHVFITITPVKRVFGNFKHKTIA